MTQPTDTTELERRLAAANPDWFNPYDHDAENSRNIFGMCGESNSSPVATAYTDQHAALIVELRNRAPSLIAELKELREIRASAAALCKSYYRQYRGLYTPLEPWVDALADVIECADPSVVLYPQKGEAP